MSKSEKRSLCNVIAAFALILGLTLTTTPPRAQAQGNANPGVIPVNKQYSKLAAEWWQWAYSFPVSINPLFDETGAQACRGDQGPGNVFFLGGVINVSGTATRNITVPTGSRLFFPILNVEWDNLGTNPPLTVAQLFQAAAVVIDSTSELHASVDGQPVPNLFGSRVKSGPFCYSVPTNDNIYQFFGAGDLLTGLECAEGFCVCPAVTDGYWLLTNPLPPGQHTLNFGGTSTRPSPFSLNITYNITVVPRGHYQGCQ